MNNGLIPNGYYFRQWIHWIGIIYYNYKLTFKRITY